MYYLGDAVHRTLELLPSEFGQLATCLQLDLDQFGRAQDHGREHGRRAPGHRVAERVHLLGVPGPGDRGNRFLAQAVAREQHRVLGYTGHHGWRRTGVQTAQTGLPVRLRQTVCGTGVKAAERLQLGLDRVQRLANQHDGHAGQRTGQQVGQAASGVGASGDCVRRHRVAAGAHVGTSRCGSTALTTFIAVRVDGLHKRRARLFS